LHLGCDDRYLGPHQAVEQRRLAGVGRAEQRDIGRALRLRSRRLVHDEPGAAAAMRASSSAAAPISAARLEDPVAVSGAKPSTLARTVKRRLCGGPSTAIVS